LKEPLLSEVKQAVAAAGDKLMTRIGWMPRTHPLELPSGRILVPLYSDGFSFGTVAITDDGGATWTASEPIVGAGSIQPSIVRKRDGSLVAYLRDNGPAPKRVMLSTSRDEGRTWSDAVDTGIPNPGSSVEVIALKDGTWLFIGNDSEQDRHSLVAMLSDDEGVTWKWRRHIESDKAGRFHYPSVIQARDGAIHLTYSYFIRGSKGEEKASKHARFNAEWVKAEH
jgi:predicted neuraminidase